MSENRISSDKPGVAIIGSGNAGKSIAHVIAEMESASMPTTVLVVGDRNMDDLVLKTGSIGMSETNELLEGMKRDASLRYSLTEIPKSVYFGFEEDKLDPKHHNGRYNKVNRKKNKQSKKARKQNRR